MNKDIEKYKNSENWFGFKNFYDYILSKENFSTYAEIGVWKGHSISYLAKNCKGKNPKFYAVDLFDDWDTTNEGVKDQIGFIYEIYNSNLNDAGVRDLITDIKGCSWEKASIFKDNYFDFIFLDGDHSYEGIYKDINAWFPKVKSGGIIGGHDYFNSKGVERAVNELVDDFKIMKNSCSWYKEK